MKEKLQFMKKHLQFMKEKQKVSDMVPKLIDQAEKVALREQLESDVKQFLKTKRITRIRSGVSALVEKDGTPKPKKRNVKLPNGNYDIWTRRR